jgi:hypothetical protein
VVLSGVCPKPEARIDCVSSSVLCLANVGVDVGRSCYASIPDTIFQPKFGEPGLSADYANIGRTENSQRTLTTPNDTQDRSLLRNVLQALGALSTPSKVA